MHWHGRATRPWELTPTHALEALRGIPVSLHCWQGDDVGGFENDQGLTGGGIQATGNYPGKARCADDLRADLDQAYKLIPGKHRLNLHAIYAETPRRTERNELGPEHFTAWIRLGPRASGLEFGFQRHVLFSSGVPPAGRTLSSHDHGVRQFWVEHGIACRKIGEHFGRRFLGSALRDQCLDSGRIQGPARGLAIAAGHSQTLTR